MKQKLLVLTAVLLSMVFLLTACQNNTEPEDETPPVASFTDYKNIPDFGAMTDTKPDEKLSQKAAERLGVEPDTVRVYRLNKDNRDQVQTWKEEVKSRGYDPSGNLEEDGNTARYYSDDRKNGVIAGYMDLDGKEGADALALLLVNKSMKDQYLDMDFEEIQGNWSNANSGGTFYINDKKIYGYGYVNSAEDGFLVKNTDSSSPQLLVEDVHPKFVLEYDKGIYAYLPGKLVLYNPKEKDPEEAITTILEEELTSLQILNDKLFFTTKDGLFQADPTGETVTKLSGKHMEDPYIVADKVFYRSPADENREHAFSLLSKADTTITEESVSSFFLGSRGYGYYITERDVEPEEDEETTTEDTAEPEENADETGVEAEEETPEEEEPTTTYALVKIALKDGTTTDLATGLADEGLLGIGNRVYFISEDQEGQIYSVAKSEGTPKRVTRDKDCRTLMTFHEMILYYDYADETEETLDHIYISTTDGFMKSDILR